MTQVTFRGIISSNGTIRVSSNASQVATLNAGFSVLVDSTTIATNASYSSEKITSTPNSNYNQYLFSEQTLIADDSGTSSPQPEPTVNEEWRDMTRTEPIPITTRTEQTSSLPQGQSNTVDGEAGIRTYYWQERFVNGDTTGEKRNERNEITKQMRQTVIYQGTGTVATEPQPVATNDDGSFSFIGNLTKVKTGVFKGTFDMSALEQIKFVADGLVIKNVAMYDKDTSLDWYRAQEDISAIDDKIEANIELTLEQLNALSQAQALAEAEMRARASAAELAQWITDYQNFVENEKALQAESKEELIRSAQRLVKIETDIGDMAQRWNFIDSYMQTTNEGIVFGKNDGSANIKISEDRISMFSGGNEVMYISQGVIHIDNGVFTDTLQVGHYLESQYEKNPDMNVMRYVGPSL